MVAPEVLYTVELGKVRYYEFGNRANRLIRRKERTVVIGVRKSFELEIHAFGR